VSSSVSPCDLSLRRGRSAGIRGGHGTTTRSPRIRRWPG